VNELTVKVKSSVLLIKYSERLVKRTRGDIVMSLSFIRSLVGEETREKALDTTN